MHTEVEWSACSDPNQMLEHLRAYPKSAFARKCWLFSVACYVRIWDQLAQPERHFVKVLEQYAINSIPWEAVLEAAQETTHRGILRLLRDHNNPLHAARAVSSETIFGESEEVRNRNRASVANLVRGIFGNPFRPFAPSHDWFDWEEGKGTALAQSACDGLGKDQQVGYLDPMLLGMLSDAVAESQAFADDIARELQQSRARVRGWFVVEALAGY